MFRRSLLRQIHLFSALVPHATQKGAVYFTKDELEVAQNAIKEREAIFEQIDMSSFLDTLAKESTFHERRNTVSLLSSTVDQLRALLYKKTFTDASKRLQVHEGIMGVGFYERLLNSNELQGENVRFVLNHYNFDVRRDTFITKCARDYLLESNTTTPESEKLIRDLLLLERRLYGPYRFLPTAGRRWFVLGLHLSEIKSEKEINHIFNLPVVKEVGNFEQSEDTSEKLWKTITIRPKAEEGEPSFMEVANAKLDFADNDAKYEIRLQKPKPPLEFRERVKELLLHYWVLLFTLWLMFWAVDEEIITLVALIYLKIKHTSILEEEAKKTGGKVYIASSSPSY